MKYHLLPQTILGNVRKKLRTPLVQSGSWRKFLVIILSLATLLGAWPRTTQAAPVLLDASFGTGGKVVTRFFGRGDDAHALAFQADGKIVAAGSAFSDATQNDFGLVRYNPNGTLDTSFDTDGKVVTIFGSGSDDAYAVAVQTDGKIVAAGRAQNGSPFDAAVARYNTNGSLDTTFDTDGKVTVDFGLSDYATAMAIQPDGKIVIAGLAQNNSFVLDFAVARLNSDGSLDTNFGTGGKVTTDFLGFNDWGNAVALQSDGKIVVGGYAQNAFSTNDDKNDFAVARYNTNGTLDTSFDTDGKMMTDFFGRGDEIHALVVQSDGKIVAGGHAHSNSSNYNFALVRYNSNGSLDTGFGTGGKVMTVFYANSILLGLALQPDGKIVAAGNISGPIACLARYNTDGSPDSSFSTDGQFYLTSSNSNVGAEAVLLQPDGKILTAGRGDDPFGNSFGGFGVQRLIAPNRPLVKPSDFDGDGKSDIAIFRPSTGLWTYVQSSDNTQRFQTWGASGDVATPGDYDGDGKTDLAVYRPGTGAWYILNSHDNSTTALFFGLSTDTPAPADYDGDGKTDVAVFRPSNGAWYILNSTTGTISSTLFGNSQDWPVPGDYDEDGLANLAVFRDNVGKWYISSPTNPTLFGVSGDKPVQADYDGDGRTDIAVFRPSNGTWYIIQSSNNSIIAQPWGLSGDRPAPADYDGDNKIDIAVWRPSNGFWYILQSSNNQFRAVPFGASGDVPIASAYVP